MDDYFSSLLFKLKKQYEIDSQINLFLSNSFNVFDLISPDENKLSDIIANLLDLNGTHGQGALFAKEFVKNLQLDIDYEQTFSVIREKNTNYISQTNRKIDILLDFNSFGIGIENKPWAGEQHDQISDYVNFLEKRYGDKFVLVYMSGDGSEPISIDDSYKAQLIKQRKLIIFPYPGALLRWLKSCNRICESEKFRWFIRDFIAYVEKNFSYV